MPRTRLLAPHLQRLRRREASTPLHLASEARVAVAAALIRGRGLSSTAADAGWAHLIGVFSLFGFMVIGFAAIVPRALAEDSDQLPPPASGLG